MTNIDIDVDGAPGLTMLATSCASGTCPTIFESDRGTYVIQGYAVDAGRAGVTLAPDELLVEIPAELLAGILAGRTPANGN
jgi:hypothetical protein